MSWRCWDTTTTRRCAGSAISLHVAQPDFAPTEGCIALARNDLLMRLNQAGPDSRVCVQVV